MKCVAMSTVHGSTVGRGGLLLQNFILITTAYNFITLYIYFIFCICLLKGNLGKGQKHYNI